MLHQYVNSHDSVPDFVSTSDISLSHEGNSFEFQKAAKIIIYCIINTIRIHTCVQKWHCSPFILHSFRSRSTSCGSWDHTILTLTNPRFIMSNILQEYLCVVLTQQFFPCKSPKWDSCVRFLFPCLFCENLLLLDLCLQISR